MTKRFNLHWILLFLFLASACTERIDVKLGSTFTRLVVDGILTSDTTVHRVKLTQTADYFSDVPAAPVSGALVTISDGSQLITLKENANLAGIYETDNNMYGVPGKTYTLNIRLLQAINGQSNYEATTRMPTVAPLDSIQLQYMPDWKVYVVKTYALDPPSVDYYMFNVFKNGVQLTDTLKNVFITDDRLFNGNYTNGAPTAFLPQEQPKYKINPGDTIMLQIAGITRDYFDFVTQLQTSTGFSNPLFGGPPANIKGNISQGAIGFFTAYSVKYAKTIAN